ncbi:MAG: tRNA dihydrouridine synthase [Promethearchaeota archaeon]
MKLGSLFLKNNLILAPLQNITTSPYRNFCRKLNTIGLVSVPMLYTKRIVNNPKSVKFHLHNIEKEKPISVQLIGNDPNALKKSIEFLESYQFDVLDINAGCPSNRALKAREGGYLLRDLNTLKTLLNIAVKYSSRPVSLKCRLGFENSDNIEELVNIINDSGIEFLTMHARLVKSRFNKYTLNLDILRKLKETLSIPVIGNGDIDNPRFAKFFLDYTNVDALMIGRGSMGNPKIFSQINDYLTKGKEIIFKNSKNLMKKYFLLYEQEVDNFLENVQLPYRREEYKFIELKRNSIWLTKNLEKATTIRIKLSKTKNLRQLKETLKIYFRFSNIS